MVTGDATVIGRGGEVVSKLLLSDSVSRASGKLVCVAVDVMEEDAAALLEEDRDEQGGT